MINSKKLQMAYKRYIKNFSEGLTLEKSLKKYEEAKIENSDIVENNETEKDHILLVNMYRISSYWLSEWKHHVLIKGEENAMGLKQIQKVVFYQCMVRHIYKDRYPNMKLIHYSFDLNIVALIHFNMYGWKKEEDVFFDFIEEYLVENIMKANDWNKHIWYLFELYLRSSNKTIFGVNQNIHMIVKLKLEEKGMNYDLIPGELGIYSEVLDRWNTPDLDEITQLIGKMSEYHSMLAAELGQSLEFGDFRYTFYPYEILFLLHVRKKQGLPNPTHFDDFLMNSPEAKIEIQDPEPYPDQDPILQLVDGYYRKNYPEYIPNKYGMLFE
ncbi:hypothetical protein [Paenibacillus hubeiensis]|uniref:hypothetical protein n=1 Tax=Paenibacillus hubeiensis TaxID=3077330 RepID=UPI0031BBCD2E